jgi:hypothetical protein
LNIHELPITYGDVFTLHSLRSYLDEHGCSKKTTLLVVSCKAQSKAIGTMIHAQDNSTNGNGAFTIGPSPQRLRPPTSMTMHGGGLIVVRNPTTRNSAQFFNPRSPSKPSYSQIVESHGKDSMIGIKHVKQIS